MNAPQQLAFDFSPICAELPASFEVAERLISSGLVPNSFILELNRGVTVPYDMDLPWPWSLPSRAFRFPLEYEAHDRAGKPHDTLLLRHPELVAHPFMATVEAAIGVRPAFEPADRFGRDATAQVCWWHAVDLMSEKHWRALLETRRFTTDDCLLGAICHALECSASYEGVGRKRGRISVETARAILSELQQVEPADHSLSRLIDRHVLMGGELSEDKGNGRKGPTRYPLNLMRRDADGAWLAVHGIEAGWFERDRSGFLQISPSGRAKRSEAAPLLQAAE